MSDQVVEVKPVSLYEKVGEWLVSDVGYELSEGGAAVLGED